MSIYQGLVTDTLEWAVYRDGSPFDPRPSQKVVNHSPGGFAWGYGGSGPAQLALALLLDQNISSNRAMQLYQLFKRDVVALWDKDGEWEITTDAIMLWIGPLREDEKP